MLDYNTKNILGRWLFRLNIVSPVVSYKYSVKAPIGEISSAKFNYANETAVDHTYRFSTSHPNIVSIPKEPIRIKSGDKAEITAMLKVMSKPMQARILIFVKEKETKKCEALLFIISYVI